MYFLVRKAVFSPKKNEIRLTISPSNIWPYHFEETESGKASESYQKKLENVIIDIMNGMLAL